MDAEADIFSVDHYSGAEAITVTMNALKSRRIVLSDFSVAPILCVSAFAEVADAVLEPIDVFMVDFIFWPFAIVNRPNETVHSDAVSSTPNSPA